MSARYLAYVGPGSGHLYPLIATFCELRERGHEVVARADREGVETLRELGFAAEPIAREAEEREDDTWQARTPIGGMRRSVAMYMDRFEHEVRDLRAAIEAERPDAVMIDNNCWGAAAATQAAGLPWAQMATFLLPLATPDAPPFGMGLRPPRGPLGRARDAAIRAVALPLFDRFAPRVNEARAEVGVEPVEHLPDLYMLAPLVIAFTAQPLEYPRPSLPDSIRFVGPANWDPARDGEAPDWLDSLDRPLVIVTSSTLFQDDAKLIQVALDALADEPVDVVATTAALDPADFEAPPNARLERFVPHSLILPRAACVVSHGGMGITQKALLEGVPLCMVPFGRDQFETARRVAEAGAGTRLPSFLLNARRLRRAVREAIEMRAGAESAGQALRSAGGARAAADALEELVPRRDERVTA
jgi:MGT family glycosyltransferase